MCFPLLARLQAARDWLKQLLLQQVRELWLPVL